MLSNVRSSLLYQLLICLQKYLSVIYFVLVFVLYWYKGQILPYQRYVRVLELMIVVPFVIIEYLRIAWGRSKHTVTDYSTPTGSRGNLLESSAFLGLSTALGVPSLLITAYVAFFQNYVLWIEAWSSYIISGFIIIEMLISMALTINFSATAPTVITA